LHTLAATRLSHTATAAPIYIMVALLSYYSQQLSSNSSNMGQNHVTGVRVRVRVRVRFRVRVRVRVKVSSNIGQTISHKGMG
jgi:hypothetical protein